MRLVPHEWPGRGICNVTFTSLGRVPAQYDAFAPWNPRVVAVVEHAIRQAWRILMLEHQAVLSTHDEDRITDRLLDVLVDIRTQGTVPGFTADLFGVPVRDAKLADWLGESIDKTPDITVYPAQPRQGISDGRHDALFLECKVLHGNRRLTQYGDEGIQRFLDGRYAWRMPHAHMVAYVFSATDRNPASALTTHFSRKRSGLPQQTNGQRLALRDGPTEVSPAGCANTRPVIQTGHLRSAPTLPGRDNPIILRHLWLCDPA